MSGWRLATLGPGGTDHERAAARYIRLRGLDCQVDLLDDLRSAVPYVLEGPKRLALANSAHPDIDLLTTRAWRSVGIVDVFVLATAPLALVHRTGAKAGGSIALMRSTRGYVELSRWDRVVEVPAKPVALTRVLNHEADWAIVSLAQYQANEARLELAEQIGPVECGWLVYAARGRVPEGVLAPAENWSPAGGRA